MADSPNPAANPITPDRQRMDPVRRFYVESGILLTLACLFVVLSQSQGWFRNIDRLIYDSMIGSLPAPQNSDIVIVAIDDASLFEFGAWPWPRSLQGQLVQRVGQFKPSLVGIDVIFGGTTLQDEILVDAAKNIEQLALPLMIDKLGQAKQHIEVLPFPSLLDEADLLGHVQVELDDDAIVRGTYLYQGVGTPAWPHLMVEVAGQMRGTPFNNNCAKRPVSIAIQKCRRIQIPFAGPPGTYPTISAKQIINGELDDALLERALAQKTVLIGVTATGAGDWVTSPTSGDAGPMSGVEFNANLLSALIYNTLILTPPIWALSLFGVLVVVTCSVVLPRLRAMPMLFTAAGMALFPIFGTVASMLISWTHLPLANTTIAVLLIYPIWSWRRHEIAWQFIQRELARINVQTQEWDALSANYLTDVRNDALLEHVSVLLDGPLSYHNAAGGEPRLMCERDIPLSSTEQQLLDAAQKEFFGPNLILPGQSGEVLAAQIRRLEVAANEVREGRTMGLAGLSKMSNGALIVSAFGEIRFANAGADKLLQLQEIGSKDALVVLSQIQPPLGKTWQEITRAIVVEKEPIFFEAIAPNSSPVYIAAEPLSEDHAQYAPNWVLTLSDLSAIRAAEAQREEALAFLSHDIRSPLLSVLALIRSSGEQSKLLEDITQYTQRGLSTSEQFLQLSRLQLQTNFETYELELEQLVQNALEQVFFLAREKNIECIADGLLDENTQSDTHEGTWVVGNGELLERAIVNVLTNAIKYSEDNTCITVRLDTEPELAVISVADQGHGIPEPELERIFDPYFRSSAPGLAGRRGAGLGLRFVKTVVDRHHGKIRVNSALGKGSTFGICLPFFDSLQIPPPESS